MGTIVQINEYILLRHLLFIFINTCYNLSGLRADNSPQRTVFNHRNFWRTFFLVLRLSLVNVTPLIFRSPLFTCIFTNAI